MLRSRYFPLLVLKGTDFHWPDVLMFSLFGDKANGSCERAPARPPAQPRGGLLGPLDPGSVAGPIRGSIRGSARRRAGFGRGAGGGGRGVSSVRHSAAMLLESKQQRAFQTQDGATSAHDTDVNSAQYLHWSFQCSVCLG